MLYNVCVVCMVYVCMLCVVWVYSVVCVCCVYCAGVACGGDVKVTSVFSCVILPLLFETGVSCQICLFLCTQSWGDKHICGSYVVQMQTLKLVQLSYVSHPYPLCHLCHPNKAIKLPSSTPSQQYSLPPSHGMACLETLKAASETGAQEK